VHLSTRDSRCTAAVNPEREKYLVLTSLVMTSQVLDPPVITGDDICCYGLRLLREQDEVHGRKVKALQEKIDRGMAQLDRGEGIPSHKAKAVLLRHSAGQRKRRA